MTGSTLKIQISEIISADSALRRKTPKQTTIITHNNSSTSTSTMTGKGTMDSDLVYLLTTVCDLNNTRNAYKAVVHAGIDTVDYFLAHGYKTPFLYDNNGTKKAIHSSHQTKLSQLIAYAIDLETKKDANARNFTSYSKDEFNKWRRQDFPTWVSTQKAKAASASANPFATNSKEKFELKSFVKMQKNIADYPVIKNEDAWYTFKTDFERVSKTHEFHRLLTSTHETKADFLASLVANSLDAELFEKQCNHLNMVFKQVLHTIKGQDIQRENEDDPITIWYQLTLLFSRVRKTTMSPRSTYAGLNVKT